MKYLLILIISLFFASCHSPKKNLQLCVADVKDYAVFCALAAQDEKEFESFKRSSIFNLMSEYHTFEEGQEYLALAFSGAPDFFCDLERLRANDLVGSPRLFTYGKWGVFSPSTLRYIKTAADLRNRFGNLDGMRVLEIGAGYGGQCKVLTDLFAIKSYTLVDLPVMLELAKTYLKKQGVKQALFLSTNELEKENKPYDLVISHYSFSESTSSLQQKYLEKLLKNSAQGYLVCNAPPKHFRVRPYSKSKIFSFLKKMHPSCQELPETPLLSSDHYVIVWDKNDFQ